MKKEKIKKKIFIKKLSGILGVVGIICGLFTGCVHGRNDIFSDSKTETTDVTFDFSDKKLNINSDYSELDISKGDTKDIEVTLVKKVRGDSEEEISEKLDSIKCTYENGYLKILSNKSDEFMNSNEVEAHIKIPESVEVLETNNDVGDIEINGDFDSLNSKVDVGRLRFNGIAKNCNVDTDTGDIELRLDKVENNYNYNLNCDIGAINIKVPNGSNINLSGKDADDIDISNGVNINKDGMNLNAKVSVGAIKIGIN